MWYCSLCYSCNIHSHRSVGSGNPQFPTPRNRSNIGGGASQFPTPSRNHFDIGVPVLPPIPTSNSVPVTTANDLPPAYKLQATPPTAHRVSPPPPYSSPATNRHLSSRVPTVAPKTYRLPNPEVSINWNELLPWGIIMLNFNSLGQLDFPAERASEDDIGDGIPTSACR